MVSRMIKFKNSVFTKLTLASLMFLPAVAFAQDNNIAGVADRIKNQLGSITDLLTGVMFMIGIGLGAMAAMKLKAHNDDPRSTKITTPIILALVSALLLALPAYLTLMKNSVVGDGAEGGSLDDSIYGNI